MQWFVHGSGHLVQIWAVLTWRVIGPECLCTWKDWQALHLWRIIVVWLQGPDVMAKLSSYPIAQLLHIFRLPL